MNRLTKECVKWLKSYFDENKSGHAVINVTNSPNAVAALRLCSEALGSENMTGVIFKTKRKSDIYSEVKMLDDLKISYNVIDIDDLVDNVINSIGLTKIDAYNKADMRSRLSMSCLYSTANSKNGLVVGSIDICAFALGEYTLWGDMCCDVNPIAMMTPSEIKTMCRDLGADYECLNETCSYSIFSEPMSSIETADGDDVERVLEKIVFSGSLSPIDASSLSFNESLIIGRINSSIQKCDYVSIPHFVDGEMISFRNIVKNDDASVK